MNIWKRLRYYLIGVGIGSVMVWFMMGTRTNEMQCSYFPNDRVLNDLAKKEISFSPLAACQFECINQDSVALNNILKAGDVDFEKSKTDMDECKEYYITSQYQDKDITGIIETCDSTAVVKSFELPLTTKCDCD